MTAPKGGRRAPVQIPSGDAAPTVPAAMAPGRGAALTPAAARRIAKASQAAGFPVPARAAAVLKAAKTEQAAHAAPAENPET